MTGEYESDGKLTFIEFDSNGVAYAYLFDGIYLKYKGQKVIEAKEFGNYEKTF